jgi:ABC-2 type transport system permease protein
MLLAGIGAAVYATSAVLRLRVEETGNLAEPLLATATGRIRWWFGRMSVAIVGAVVLLTAAGLSAGLGFGILTGTVSTQVPRLLSASLVRLPAVLVIAAVVALPVGLLPWASIGAAWTAMAVVGIIAVFGPSLQWPPWMMDISPFTHIPPLPGATVSTEPLLWLCGVALGLDIASMIGLRRRDFGDLGPFGLSGPIGTTIDETMRDEPA